MKLLTYSLPGVVLGFAYLLFGGCSLNANEKVSNDNPQDSTEGWKIQQSYQRELNPILSLRAEDSFLVVGTRALPISYLDSLNGNARDGVITTSGFQHRGRKPALSTQVAFIFGEDAGSFGVNGQYPGLIRVNYFLSEIDSAFADDASIFSNYVSGEIGSASDSNSVVLLIDVHRPYETVKQCGRDGNLVILKVLPTEISNTRKPTIQVLENKPIEIFEILNKRFHKGYFYLATTNGIGRISEKGGELEWWLHVKGLYCDISLSVDSSIVPYSKEWDRAKDSLYKNPPKGFSDIAFSGDSVFALEISGRLWASGDNGKTWDSTYSIPFSSTEGLIHTNNFFGFRYHGELFQIDFEERSTRRIETKELDNVMINDVAEFQGRLYLATDGGLYSKPMDELMREP